jgi:flagellar biosynthetic protein FliR
VDDVNMPASLTPLIPHVIPFLLVMFRLSGIFLLAPVFGSNAVPARVKALLSLVLAFCVYPLIGELQVIELSIPTLVVAVAGELTIGLAMGLCMTIPIVAMQVAGQMIGHQLVPGPGVFNTDTLSEQTVIEQAFFLLALVIFLLMNGHYVLLEILVRTFEPGGIPLGGYAPAAGVIGTVVALLQGGFELALRIAAPLLCLVFLQMIAMGFIARTVPQLNIFSLGFPLRIILGLALTGSMLILIAEPLQQFIERSLMALSDLFEPIGPA